MKASKLLTPAELETIEGAVAAAERQTSAEIVVVLATRSGRYDRGEDLVGVVFALIAVALTWSVTQRFAIDYSGWVPAATARLGLIEILALILGAFSVGTVLASRVPILGTFFTSRAEMRVEVEEQALAAFHRLAVRRTAGASGVLIYLSLLERMVWVVGDDAISTRLGRDDYASLRDAVVDGFTSGSPAQGLEKAVARCGALLAEAVPARAEEPDELHNRVRFLD